MTAANVTDHVVVYGRFSVSRPFGPLRLGDNIPECGSSRSLPLGPYENPRLAAAWLKGGHGAAPLTKWMWHLRHSRTGIAPGQSLLNLNLTGACWCGRWAQGISQLS